MLLRDDLQGWQRLNVCAFLVSGVAAANPDIIGDPYVDADDTAYLSMFRQPVLVFQGDATLLRWARQRALGRDRDLTPAIFTADLSRPATTATTGPRSGQWLATTSKSSAWPCTAQERRGQGAQGRDDASLTAVVGRVEPSGQLTEKPPSTMISCPVT